MKDCFFNCFPQAGGSDYLRHRNLPSPGNSGTSRCHEESRTYTLFPSVMPGGPPHGRRGIVRCLCNVNTFDKIPALSNLLLFHDRKFKIDSLNNKKNFDSLVAFVARAPCTVHMALLLFGIPSKNPDALHAFHSSP
jgi:hypothetical protein